MNRLPLFAGRYYFPDAGRLQAAILSYIEDSPVARPSTSSGQASTSSGQASTSSGQASTSSGQAGGELAGLIVPHGPLMEMGPVAGHAYKLLLTAPLHSDTVTLLAPTQHDGPALQCDPRDAYDTPLDPLRIDRAAVQGLRAAGFTIDDCDDEEPVIECQAPFVLTALGDVPVTPLRVPANVDATPMLADMAKLGLVIAVANLPAGREAPACEAIVRLDAGYFTGEAPSRRRGLSSLFAGKPALLERDADNAVLGLSLALARENGATHGKLLIRKGVYAACALYRD